MRKSLIFSAIALAALAFVGCSKDEVVSESPSLNNAIEFGTYLGRSAKTRGPATTTGTIQESNATGFGVLAYYTGTSTFAQSQSLSPNFMYNQQVTYEVDAWTYSPKKYWPTRQGDKISFFAYAPYEEQSTNNIIKLSANNVTGTPTVTFTIENNADDMVDFVADACIDKTWNNDGTDEGTDEGTDGVTESEVKFTLLHELTRVSFKAKVNEHDELGSGETSDTRVAITSITLNGGEGTNLYKSAIYTFPTDNNGDIRGSWNLTNGTLANDYNIEDVLDLKDFEDSDLSPLADNKTFEDGDYKAIWLNPTITEADEIFKGSEYLFLIPPAGEAGVTTKDSNDPMSITVSYDIITKDDNLEKGYSITSATKTVSLGGDTNTPLLKQGYSYVYTLIFGIDEIKVSADVSQWTDSTDNIEVDYTTDDAQ